MHFTLVMMRQFKKPNESWTPLRNPKAQYGRQAKVYYGNPERGVMKIVKDYNEMDALEKLEGRKVLVLYSNLIHQVVNGQWSAVGKVDKDGNIIYRR